MDIYRELYKLADRVAYPYYVPGMTHEDLVQECVIHAASSEKCLTNFQNPGGKSYVAKAMRMRIYRLISNNQKHANLPIFEDELYHVKGEETIEIPIPKITSRAEILTILMLENDLNEKKCAELLGWSYDSTAKVWKIAKTAIKKELQSMPHYKNLCSEN